MGNKQALHGTKPVLIEKDKNTVENEKLTSGKLVFQTPPPTSSLLPTCFE